MFNSVVMVHNELCFGGWFSCFGFISVFGIRFVYCWCDILCFTVAGVIVLLLETIGCCLRCECCLVGYCLVGLVLVFALVDYISVLMVRVGLADVP